MKQNTTLQNSIIHLEGLESIWEHLHLRSAIQYFWLGRQPYISVWGLQKQLHSKRVAGEIPDVVLLLEHDPVYTFGKNADTNLLLDSKPHDAEVVQIDRGGQVTYHGPGQLVCYPIIDLHNYQMSVSWYIRSLEGVIINCLKKLGIKSARKKDLPGVWVDDNKICAMGVRLSRWVTMHGFALNQKVDMKYFDGMIPCGIFNYGVTSIKDQGINISMDRLVENIANSFASLFEGRINEV